jgi:hypothetical protein
MIKKRTTRIECKSSLHSFCFFKGNPSPPQKKGSNIQSFDAQKIGIKT